MSEPKPTSGAKGGLRDAIIPLAAAIAIGGLGYYFLFGRPPDRGAGISAPTTGCVLNPPERIGGAIALVDHEGRSATQANFAGSPTLVYFGFTHCPDICPTSMYLVADALTVLGRSGRQIKTALVTVDPDRDTPEAMRDYVGTDGFPPGLVGLTGDQDEIAAAARAFAVNYARLPAGDDYTMSHTSFLYVMDDEWRTRAVVSTIGRTPQEIAACIRDGLGDRLVGG